MTRVAPLARSRDRFRRHGFRVPSARDGLLALMRALELSRDDCVLLPAYVGWSRREGSGVFDPVRSLGTSWAFYQITPSFGIDLEDLEKKLDEVSPRLVVLIHYFGFPASGAREAARVAKAKGAFVVEDEAHSLFSDLVGGSTGRDGDASIHSLHKMLPVDGGGLVVLNGQNDALAARLDALVPPCAGIPNLLSFDLPAISSARRRNAKYLRRALQPLEGRLDPVFDRLPDGVVP